jgi:hypothetical protein
VLDGYSLAAKGIGFTHPTGAGATTDENAFALVRERRHPWLVLELGVEQVLERHRRVSQAQQERWATSRSKVWAASLKASLIVR